MKFLDRVNFFGQVAELDAQGRVLIQPRLRESAQMTGEVDVLGQQNFLEVWNHERFVAKLTRDPFTDDDAQGARGLRNLTARTARVHVPVLRRRSACRLLAAGARRRSSSIARSGSAGTRARCSQRGASRLIGLDRDPAALAVARDALADWGDRSSWCTPTIASSTRVLDGARASIGSTACWPISACRRCSSMREGRGFSFRRDEPLDMRMDPTARRDGRRSAGARGRNGAGRRDLPVRRRAALAAHRARAGRAREHERPLETTGQVADIVRRASRAARAGSGSTRRRARFRRCASGSTASSTGWTRFSTSAAGRLAPGRRLAVITFHSLEDRIVKHTFRAASASASRRAARAVLTQAPDRDAVGERRG